MKTQAKTYETIAANTKTVDTTTGMNGYPERLRIAYTADTMGELRELKETAEAEGHAVDILLLHRRDGWALWERSNDHDLDDDRWLRTSGNDWTIDIDNGSDRMAEAFRAVCGEGYQVEAAADLFAKAEAVGELAEQLADPDYLEDGEIVRHWLDDHGQVKYTVRTGQNGYAYDTHQYCTALLIEEREEDEEDEEA